MNNYIKANELSAKYCKENYLYHERLGSSDIQEFINNFANWIDKQDYRIEKPETVNYGITMINILSSNPVSEHLGLPFNSGQQVLYFNTLTGQYEVRHKSWFKKGEPDFIEHVDCNFEECLIEDIKEGEFFIPDYKTDDPLIKTQLKICMKISDTETAGISGNQKSVIVESNFHDFETYHKITVKS